MRRPTCLLIAFMVFGGATAPAQDGGDSALFKLIRRRYDADRDGRVTAEEYGAARDRFRRLDRDGDGALTNADFRSSGGEKPKAEGEAPKDGAAQGSGEEAPKAADKAAAPAPAAPAPAALSADDLKFFETKIRPVLAMNCYECHGPSGRARGDLRLSSREAFLKGGHEGPPVVPGDVEGSLLIRSLRYQDEDLQMPPKGRLPDAVIKDFETWVARGAPYPADLKPAADTATEVAPGAEDAGHAIDWNKAKSFWAFRKPINQPPPLVKNEAWAWTDVDRFLLGDMEQAGLKPVGDADKRTWLRRATFDLTGLPPTPEELEAFEKDQRPDAYDRAVDRLLASPQFGERWGRHWLDVARYAESSGKDSNLVYPHAWRYRDYVVASVNEDKPYDLFLKEQLAGDLMPATDAKDRATKQVATGFLAIGSKGHNTRGREQFAMDLADEQIDATTQAMLGLTVACARCHDHKFDPIPQRDYYAMAGVFLSTETCYGTVRSNGNGHPSKLVPLAADAGQSDGAPLPMALKRQMEFQRDRLKEIAGAAPDARPRRPGTPPKPGQPEPDRQDALRMRIARQQAAALDAALARFDAFGKPKPENRVAMGARDRRTAEDAKLLERGEIDRPAGRVPRGFLTVLSNDDGGLQVRKGSGRLELAERIASADNPLTARVFVNRVWLHLFGEGLVPTPDNFGASGTPPTHPALLDHLAVTFAQDGWSLKRLLKRLMTSHAYRLSSDFDAANAKIDPDAVRRWRMPKRRLEAEALRDAMLAVAGMLDLKAPVASPLNGVEGQIRNEELLKVVLGEEEPVRSLYLPVVRDLLPHSLEVFDFAESSFVVGAREVTNVASQALYLMNDPDVLRASSAFAGRLLAKKTTDDGRIAYAFELVYGRKPTGSETAAAKNFLAAFRAAPPLRDEPVREGGARRGGRRGGRIADFLGLGGRTAAAEREDPVRASWSALCQALFQAAEFRFLD